VVDKDSLLRLAEVAKGHTGFSFAAFSPIAAVRFRRGELKEAEMESRADRAPFPLLFRALILAEQQHTGSKPALDSAKRGYEFLVDQSRIIPDWTARLEWELLAAEVETLLKKP
jgi:hypothetical protein